MTLVGKVTEITGQAYVMTADSMQQLAMGSQVALGDSIVTPAGVSVNLLFGNSTLIHIAPEQQVAISDAITAANQPSQADSGISKATIDTVMSAIASSYDIGDAIMQDGAGSDELAALYGLRFFDLAMTADVAVANADVLDLRDLISGESHGLGSDNLSHYLHFEKSGTDTLVHVSCSGQYDAAIGSANDVHTITLAGVDLVTGFASDYSFASDHALIQDLLSRFIVQIYCLGKS